MQTEDKINQIYFLKIYFTQLNKINTIMFQGYACFHKIQIYIDLCKRLTTKRY